MKIRPARCIGGRLRVPGDKSISHRAAMMAALADGQSVLSNFSTSHDCASTLDCLRALGVTIEQESSSVRIAGVGLRGLRAPSGSLDCGNSGSTMRMLAGILAGQPFTSTMIGDDSLQSRPMKRIIEPLELMGARVHAQEERPPLRIDGSESLKPIRYELPVASAQVKSCVLLAGLFADGHTEVVERSGATRDHTERLLEWYGVPVAIEDEIEGGETAHVVSVEGPERLSALDVSIASDISSAAFFIAAAALLTSADLELMDIGVNPTRALFLDVMKSLGANLVVENAREESNEPVANIHIRGGIGNVGARTAGGRTVIRGAQIPQLIDELPMLAVVGTQVAGGLEIRDAGELRVKEADRISTTVTNLRALGAEVEEYNDGLAVAGPTRLHGARVDSCGDHRIAMAFTIAALVADGESEIVGAECAGVSFPEFFDLLESVVER